MGLREIKNKINLTKNIFNLSQALELISAVKAKKLKNSALGSRPFAKKSIEILMRLIQYQRLFKPISLQPKKVGRILAIVFASDRGFCGLYNKNILRYAEKEIEELKKEAEVELITIGKKAGRFFKKKNEKIKIEFSEIKEFEEKERAKELFNLVSKPYQKGEYQKVIFFCIHYFTPFFQLPRKIQILPLDEERLKEMLEKIVGKIPPIERYDYLFEPSFEKIFEELTFHLMESEIYHAILEARASEEMSRMMAMKRAMDNAKEIIKNLILKYNKARQAQITAEVCEITIAKEVTK